MGGDLAVASEPGRGTCFTVVLPLLELSVEEMLTQAAPGVEDVDLSRNDALAGVCILLTEDNPSLLKMTRLLLEQQGATVVLANNGQEALDALRAGAEPDLVLMDMQMPVLGGVDATHAIRQRYSREELPVLAMTANATRQDRDAAAAVGMNDFLAKPLDFRRLVAALRQHLALEPADAGIRAAPPGGLATGTFQDFDLAGALARMTGQVDIYREAAEPFLAGYEVQLAQLAEAVAAGDNAAAARLSHELKGSASLLGAQALLAAAARAEVCFRDEAPGPAAARALLAELRGACDNAVATLRDILADQDGPSGDQAQ
jgi:CheY-like chemotaxis protein/HPt (histidine-containing phosphotransfer) domain-containing protein